MVTLNDFKKISPYVWELGKDFRAGMSVPARIYATEKMLQHLLNERAVEQLVNMATLPGVEKYVMAMPDVHQGYGFPIGGVAAMRADDGIISPGGVGYDINCGVRCLVSQYSRHELKKKIEKLANQMQREVPSGVGREGIINLSSSQMNEVLDSGVKWAKKNGYASDQDEDVIEEHGSYAAADAKCVSDEAKYRGSKQLGTLGAGNHFVEIQEVVEVFDEEVAKNFGIFLQQVVITIHTGSRGLGHQVCTDYVRLMNQKSNGLNIELPDRELICSSFSSDIGQQYFHAMAAAANFAWTNRQIITHHIRGAWQRVLGSNDKNRLDLVYDVAHNMAKLEVHDGKKFIVHRKGATRAFAPGHSELPEKYQSTGQPIFIPGSMGTFSYVLAGTREAMQKTFGSTCHGAGRSMSRMKAKKSIDYGQLNARLKKYGVVVRANSRKGLVEEAPEAYKNIENVVEVVSQCNIAKKIAKLKPLAVIKG
jgi:tRNA-splicing ligase RtcB (3'-phosphate/5'-hydroxy nucleic acid ligase)